MDFAFEKELNNTFRLDNMQIPVLSLISAIKLNFTLHVYIT